MTLARTTAACEIVKGQIVERPVDAFLESCLAQYLAVTFYAEMEERIAEIISARLQEFTNTTLGKFLTANMEKIIRRTPKSEIANLLSSFGDEFTEAFNKQISETEVSLYSNVITARHGVGHRQGSTITLPEIERGVSAAAKILAALESCFDLDKPPPKKRASSRRKSSGRASKKKSRKVVITRTASKAK